MKFLKSIVFRLDGQLRYYNLYNIENDKYCALKISQGQYSVLAQIEFKIGNSVLGNSGGMDPNIEEKLIMLKFLLNLN